MIRAVQGLNSEARQHSMFQDRRDLGTFWSQGIQRPFWRFHQAAKGRRKNVGEEKDEQKDPELGKPGLGGERRHRELRRGEEGLGLAGDEAENALP